MQFYGVLFGCCFFCFFHMESEASNWDLALVGQVKLRLSNLRSCDDGREDGKRFGFVLT